MKASVERRKGRTWTRPLPKEGIIERTFKNTLTFVLWQGSG